MSLMLPQTPAAPLLSRRELLQRSGLGFGGLALTYLLNSDGLLGAESLRPRSGHFPAQAKAVIQFMQNGGPSQMDLFDPKPELQKRSGKPSPQSVETFQMGNTQSLLGSPFKFHK